MSETLNTNKILRRISYPRLSPKTGNHDVKMSLPTKDPPPIDADRVFKMSYNSRDFRNSDISSGSVNVMNSLKEKLAAKSATGNISGGAKTTPSRVHAMLNDQLGVVEDEPELRFHSDQTKTVPSKVFQALQHSYPGVEEPQPLSPRGYHALKPSEKEIEDHDTYERFVGNPTNKVPSKVFQALQHTYGTGGDPARDTRQHQSTNTRSFNERNTSHIPSKSFQMLNQQYSEEKDHQATATISDDLQHALDLLEKELDAMSTTKSNSSVNPATTVPIHKGLQANQSSYQDMAPLSSYENKKLEVPLYRRGVPNIGHESYSPQHGPVAAPPVPVRVDSRRFQHSRRDPHDIKYEAPVAKNQGSPNVPQYQRNFPRDESDIMVAPVAHVEKVVAYSAEFETPWINPKAEKPKGSRSLIIKPKSSSRHSKDGRTDSFDSSSSYSSIQERIPDFDPETYVITTKPPSVSSHGRRSDSLESGQSFSSHSSNTEPRHDDENEDHIIVTGNSPSEVLQQLGKPRKMVINVNGKARLSESEKTADKHDVKTEQDRNRMPSEVETAKLKDLTLERVASEEINEVFVQNDKQMVDEKRIPAQSRIKIESVARKSNKSSSESPKSPPVNVQISRNSNRRSIKLDESMMYDDHPASKQSQSPVNDSYPNSTHSSSTTSQRRLPARDESFIVASEVKDSNEMSEERLKEAFEAINATADRILDQIDRVGSFPNNEVDNGDYYAYKNGSDVQSSADSQIRNGTQLDQNANECLPREEESFSSTGEPNKMRFIRRTEISPIRISNKQPAMEPSNCQISAASPGIRITLPAFTVKVSTGQSTSQGQAKYER